MTTGIDFLVENWVVTLILAVLWVEITRRLLAMIESDLQKRAGFLLVVFVGIFWPVFFLLAVVVNFWRLPRSWQPPDSDNPPR